MELLKPSEAIVLLQLVREIKDTIDDWQYIKIKLSPDTRERIDIDRFADGLMKMYKFKKGKIYICNNKDIFMMVRLGKLSDHKIVTQRIVKTFPEYNFDVFVDNVSRVGVIKLEFIIQGINEPEEAAARDAYAMPLEPIGPPSFTGLPAAEPPEIVRQMRSNNLIIVADDDKYIRTLIESALGLQAEVHNIGDGGSVLDAYLHFIPDMILLDIHLPGKNGHALCKEILEVDPNAYIVMLSADSSKENVMLSRQQGAVGFLTKPFDKGHLMEYWVNCPSRR